MHIHIEKVQQERKGVGGGASSVKLNCTVPVPWLRDARLAGWVTYCRIRAGQEKVQLYYIVKTILPISLFFIYVY